MIFSSTDCDLEKQGPCAQSMHIHYKLQVGHGRVDGRPRAQAPGLAFVLHAMLMAVHGYRLYNLLKIARLCSCYNDVLSIKSVQIVEL